MEHSPMQLLLDGHLTGPLLDDAKQIIDTTRDYAYRAVNVAMVQRNWLPGRRIAEETLHGEDRADYGTQVIKDLSKSLTELYGSGFTKTNLYQFVQFYKLFPNIFHSVSGKSPMFCHGRITACFYAFWTTRLATGMRGKPCPKGGASVHWIGTSHHSITSDCSGRKTKPPSRLK